MDEPSAELLARLRAGDDGAATEVFERYVHRLTLLARSRLSSRMAGRIDPEDVIQSAFRSFFVGAQRGQFSLKRGGDLWRLLVAIAMRKLYRGAKRHSAQKRSVDAEETLASTFDLAGLTVSQEPTPAEAVALADEMEAVMTRLDHFGRRVLELRLQGEQLAEIAADTGRSERSVRRILATLRDQFSRRLRAGNE
ncbi:MAG: sigma-70 family RNA polymerase sigma factor [Planctomycetaceae bacterium]|jgi:RNA polymerase sigma factor (sigma-70 family)|nr:sigma-70 family RNA polymerase sigma factor [Planctomycetaceae bacterium]MBT6153576.1 sigma-70 family RNA polymerase sigma factor [Planctomycetaceae bacterium]MBT6483043.1 sigma-70 family RNA polymerase sigma factor [Planctomycetaceae bacterium]MBT6497596.1 sigma-70 family RNA polymerase sigma factor [Planctomycetaceae bacterium]